MRLLAALLTLGALAAGCGSEPGAADPSASGASAQDGTVGNGLTAVATVFPLAWIVTQVAPGADLAYLGERGQDPHDLELSPGDREVLETADVVAFMGHLGFQPQVESAVPGVSGVLVDVAEIAGPQRTREAGHDDGHDHDGGEAIDPHLWFDPAVMADVAEETGAAFAAADPDRAEGYRTGAAAAAEQLSAVQGDIASLLEDCRHETAIVSHEAYAYLLEPHGLDQEGVAGTGGHGEASPRRLAELTDRIREEGISAVAAEPLEGRADAEVLASEAGADIVEIDSLEVASDEQLRIGYPELLRQQAEAFATVLECG